MTSAASNYHESTQFIHQRYEDTAIIIFNQQQKVRQDEKRREKHSKSSQHSRFAAPVTNQHPEYSRYGNQGVMAIETGSPAKLEAIQSLKSPESPSVQPTVNSSSDTVDHARRIRRDRPNSKTMYFIETNV